jgi:hypothetical protein
MPKRIQCKKCWKGLHHKPKYYVYEVVGVGSGRKQYNKGVFCADCISKLMER